MDKSRNCGYGREGDQSLDGPILVCESIGLGYYPRSGTGLRRYQSWIGPYLPLIRCFPVVPYRSEALELRYLEA